MAGIPPLSIILPKGSHPLLCIRIGCHRGKQKKIAPAAKTVEAIMFLFLSAVGTDLVLTLILPVPKTMNDARP